MTPIRENLDLIQTLIALVGVVGTVLTLVYAARQLRAERRAAQADLMLRFDDMLNRYDPVHKRLRPGGDWHLGKTISPEEWPDVERYMGLFERIKIIMDDGFLDIGTFDRLYGYRIDNIVANRQIHEEKLVRRAHGWRDFNALAQRLARHRSKTGN